MTIKTHVNSISSTVTQAFTGTLEVGDETVPAVVRFSDGSVSLVVGDDEVGAWPKGEVGFVDAANGYEIRAEGDSIRFLPDRHSEFSRYVAPPLPGSPEPARPAYGRSSAAAPPMSYERPQQEGPGRADEDVAWETPVDLDDPTPLVARDDADPGSSSDAEEIREALAGHPDGGGDEPRHEPDEETDQETEEPGISVEEPDEYFAAGLNGPPGGDSPPGFQSTFSRPAPPSTGTKTQSAPAPDLPDPPAETPHAQEPGPAMVAEPEEPERDSGADDHVEWATPAGRTEPPASPGEPPAPDAPSSSGISPVEPDAESPVRPLREPDGEGGLYEVPPVGPDLEDDASRPPPPELEPSAPSRLARLLQRVRPTGADTSDADRAPSYHGDDDLPAPISDSDNLKQWLLVAAGGVVLLVILGVVAWGLVSLMGSDDPVAAAEPEQVVTTVPAPAATTPTPAPSVTAPPPTTVPPENAAAASAFVATWNDLASDYAYHLTISADSLPISTAPAATVHLTYDDEGVLLLTMAPKGTGTDRDILVAMGLAVAWADPGLNPEGRKQLLGSMGIDVDDPQINDMGGEVDRNGVSYSTWIDDGIIRFQVDPAA